MVNVEIEISIEDCRTLYTAVCDAIQHWPGSPARPAQEQIKLQQMKTFLFSILCEASLDLWKKVVVTLLESLKKRAKGQGNILKQIMDVKNTKDKENNI